MRKAIVTLLTLAFLSSGVLFYGGRTIPVALAQDAEFDPRNLCLDPALAVIGTLSNDAEWLICRAPAQLRIGAAIVFSHGTVSALNPNNAGKLEAIQEQLGFDGITIPRVVNGLGFDFAVSARSKVGLSVLQGIEELNELINDVLLDPEYPDPPSNILLIGVSQGGLIATLANEDFGNYSTNGALSVCGPIGSFRFQAQYLLDFMVVSEFFLRPIIRQVLSDQGLASNTLLETDENGNPRIPPEVLAQWSTIRDAILDGTDSQTLNKILTCANVPRDSDGTHSLREITEDLFDESVRANNDAIAVLSGNPASNPNRFYVCNNFRDSLRLNRGVKRFSATADPALVEHHETTGELFNPLVTLHNWPDHRVPFRHELFHGLKAFKTGSSDLFTALPVFRFGHCNVEPAEAVGALTLLVLQATGGELYEPERVLPDAESHTRFREFIEQFNMHP